MQLSRFKSLIVVCFAYLIAISVGIYIVSFYNSSLFFRILSADILATVIIYIFSFIYRNSSIYDPYWSVIPPFILIYYILDIGYLNFQSILLLFSVLFWSIRLTFNWLRGWPGMHHEDWRYLDMRKYSGKYFEFSNFLGIHLFPTLIVFACCLPMYSAVNKDLNVFTFIGFLICFIGVLYEIISDQQLFNFKKLNNGIIKSGLWKHSRHPNYYGEILFWWGIFIYGLTYDNFFQWVLAPISMTIMFLYVSIPWIENKILRTRPDYKDYQSKVSILLPEISYVKSLFK